jgi:hypothetical protein
LAAKTIIGFRSASIVKTDSENGTFILLYPVRQFDQTANSNSSDRRSGRPRCASRTSQGRYDPMTLTWSGNWVVSPIRRTLVSSQIRLLAWRRPNPSGQTRFLYSIGPGASESVAPAN